MSDTIQQVQAAAMNGLSRVEIEALLTRKLTDDEIQAFNRVKAITKLKSIKDKKNTAIENIENPQSDQLNAPVADRYTDEHVAAVIWRTHGLTSSICAALDCSNQQWHSYLEKRPQMKQEWIDARQGMVDLAEKKLMQNLNSTDEGVSQRAAEFILRRIGSQRGWGDSPVIQQSISTEDGRTKILQIFGLDDGQQ